MESKHHFAFRFGNITEIKSVYKTGVAQLMLRHFTIYPVFN